MAAWAGAGSGPASTGGGAGGGSGGLLLEILRLTGDGAAPVSFAAISAAVFLNLANLFAEGKPMSAKLCVPKAASAAGMRSSSRGTISINGGVLKSIGYTSSSGVSTTHRVPLMGSRRSRSW